MFFIFLKNKELLNKNIWKENILTMIISGRNRIKGQGKTYVKNKSKIPLNFDLSSLDLLCNFVISENRNIRKLQYINLRNLIDMLDMERYVSDQERYKRILIK